MRELLAIVLLLASCGKVPPIEDVIPNGVICKARITMPSGEVRYSEWWFATEPKVYREEVEVGVYIYDCRNAGPKP